jgi:hypothetical protein
MYVIPSTYPFVAASVELTGAVLSVVTPVTTRFPPTLELPPTPIPPETTRAPVEAFVDAVVFVTDTTPDDVNALKSVDPVTDSVDPRNTAPLIPDPPFTTNAPVVHDTEAVVDETFTFGAFKIAETKVKDPFVVIIELVFP